ncbi:MAG: hypothetical protein AB7O62_05410 [Pirellulales bacterium]
MSDAALDRKALDAAPAGDRTAQADEARAFWRLRRRRMANMARQALAEGRLRLGTIILLTGVFWAGLYLLFAEGFHFLDLAIQHADTLDLVISKVFELFFFSLLVMLVFSSGIILYGSLFSSRETSYLLTTPASEGRIFIHKFQEAMLFSSWGSLLLGTPLAVAYGVESQAPWYYYLLMPPALVAFVYIPGAVGAIACLAIVRFLPRNRLRLLWILAGLTFLGGAWLAVSAARASTDHLLTSGWFREVLGRLEFSDYRLLPSWWLSAALRETAAGIWPQGMLFLALLVSNALFCHLLAVTAAERWYRPAYSELYNQSITLRGMWLTPVDRAVERFAWPLSRHMRLLLVKDLRIFRRDPVQWSQFLIFFGLLGMYFLNVRRLTYNADSTSWIHLISFLNLTVVGLILSTFTTRFIFPLMSLEGRRFWILGLLPLSRQAILWSKFLFALIGSLATCLSLIGLSDLMLRVDPLVAAMHVLTCLAMSSGLSGIAVGLGAALPDMREDSPTKIAAGFGGTLNLVLSTIFVLAVVLCVALPCHLYVSGGQLTDGSLFWNEGMVLRWLIVGACGTAALGILATAFPLWMGFRAFRRMEF